MVGCSTDGVSFVGASVGDSVSTGVRGDGVFVNVGGGGGM
jgi:hypothetical protein